MSALALESAARRAMVANDRDRGVCAREWDTVPERERRRWRAVAAAVLDPAASVEPFPLHPNPELVEHLDDEPTLEELC